MVTPHLINTFRFQVFLQITVKRSLAFACAPSGTDPYVQYYCIRLLQLVKHEIADWDMGEVFSDLVRNIESILLAYSNSL